MAFVDLDTAVGEIGQACSDNPRADIKHPFFFMLGAGISFPSIPLAAGIVDQTMRKAIGLGRSDPPPSALPIDAYSYWFERAYPQARSRQGFLRGLIHGQPISPASFRLAHLLL